MNTELAQAVDAAVRAVCPIVGVSIAKKTDKSTWRVDFDPSATPTQRAAGSAAVDNFDLASWTGVVDDNDFQNLTRAFRAKCISDLAFRLGVAPGALTPTQIQAERARIKAIADALL